MNLIEKLGLEKCKQIVDGAPDWAKAYCAETKAYYDISSADDLLSCCDELKPVRLALADHDRIDTCSDIANHISPNTKVIEHE